MTDGFSVDLGALENAAAGVNTTLNDLAAHKVSDVQVSLPPWIGRFGGVARPNE